MTSTSTMVQLADPTATTAASSPVSPSALSPLLIVLDILSALFRFLFSINYSLLITRIFHVVALPFRIILYPLSFVANILLTLLAPAIYTVSYVLAGVRAVMAFFAGLEPLYTFFGAAAGVGIMTGVVLAISSSLLTSSLGMQDDDTNKRPSSKQSLLQDSASRPSSSGTELDWQWLDSPSHRHLPTGGLLSQTIHEEVDDSEY